MNIAGASAYGFCMTFPSLSLSPQMQVLLVDNAINFVAAGVMLIFLRPFRRGEKIETDKHVGVVRDLGLFRTIIATDDGVLVSIPNAAIFSGTIINYHRETVRRTNFCVPLDPTENLEEVQAI